MEENIPIEVLVVDDDKSLCEGTAALINAGRGYHAAYVQSGAQALAFLEERPATAIVLLDFNLGPEQMNGLDTLKQIKKKNKVVQVIMLTIEDTLTTGIECMKEGAFDYMTKPFHIKIFTEKAVAALEKMRLTELTENEKNAMLTGLAEGLSHTINNRLSDFSLSSSVLIKEIEKLMESGFRDMEGNLEVKNSMDNILAVAYGISNNVVKTAGIVRGISNYAQMKAQGATNTYFSFEDSVDAALRVLRIKGGIGDFPLEQEVSGGMSGNIAVLTEVLIAVLENAYEATQEKAGFSGLGGYSPHIKLSVMNENGRHTLQVTDNGIGIKEDVSHKIYAPYFTTKASARNYIGSSLFIVRRIVSEEYGGRILCSSEWMKGTTILIEIPASG
jgi:signal transduction histidine kinase